MSIQDQDQNQLSDNLEETFLFQPKLNDLINILQQFDHNKSPTVNVSFLKELINNASDTHDRRRYQNPSETNLMIKIKPNLQSKTLTILDMGMGMSKSELIQNLGSNYRGVLGMIIDKLKQDSNMIYSDSNMLTFGFYSVFMVAERVVVISRTNGNEQYRWETIGDGKFKIRKDDSELLDHDGTMVTLYLKEDCEKYLDVEILKQVTKGYVRSIRYPVMLETLDKKWELLNDKQRYIWTRKPELVLKSEYCEFYKEFSGDWEDYLAVSQLFVDGQLEFSLLIFIPKIADYNGLPFSNLYVRNQLVMEHCQDLLPEYLRFVRLVVNSEDLPLNMSRDNLSGNKIIKVLNKRATKKILEMIQCIYANKEEFECFYNSFGRNIKMGVLVDDLNILTLKEMLRYHSNYRGDTWISLRDYLKRMKEDQDVIYYHTCCENSNKENEIILEEYSKKGFEVLLFNDTIDEFVADKLKEFDNKKFMKIE